MKNATKQLIEDVNDPKLRVDQIISLINHLFYNELDIRSLAYKFDELFDLTYTSDLLALLILKLDQCLLELREVSDRLRSQNVLIRMLEVQIQKLKEKSPSINAKSSSIYSNNNSAAAREGGFRSSKWNKIEPYSDSFQNMKDCLIGFVFNPNTDKLYPGFLDDVEETFQIFITIIELSDQITDIEKLELYDMIEALRFAKLTSPVKMSLDDTKPTFFEIYNLPELFKEIYGEHYIVLFENIIKKLERLIKIIEHLEKLYPSNLPYLTVYTVRLKLLIQNLTRLLEAKKEAETFLHQLNSGSTHMQYILKYLNYQKVRPTLYLFYTFEDVLRSFGYFKPEDEKLVNNELRELYSLHKSRLN